MFSRKHSKVGLKGMKLEIERIDIGRQYMEAKLRWLRTLIRNEDNPTRLAVFNYQPMLDTFLFGESLEKYEEKASKNEEWNELVGEVIERHTGYSKFSFK